MLEESNIENVSVSNSPTDVNCRDEQPLPKVISNPDEKIRRFLVYWTAFAMTLILIIFAVTRDGNHPNQQHSFCSSHYSNLHLLLQKRR